VQTREWVLTAAVIVIPLIIAAVVTIWSLDQVRYRPKKRRPVPVAARETGIPAEGGVNSDSGRSASGGS
jgi:hypothetical protein